MEKPMVAAVVKAVNIAVKATCRLLTFDNRFDMAIYKIKL